MKCADLHTENDGKAQHLVQAGLAYLNSVQTGRAGDSTSRQASPDTHTDEQNNAQSPSAGSDSVGGMSRQEALQAAASALQRAFSFVALDGASWHALSIAQFGLEQYDKAAESAEQAAQSSSTSAAKLQAVDVLIRIGEAADNEDVKSRARSSASQAVEALSAAADVDASALEARKRSLKN